MPAYVILHTAEILDEELHAEFRSRVGPLLEARGGKYLMRGNVSEVIGGDSTGHNRVAVMEFETTEQAQEWARDPQPPGEYAELRDLRNRAARSVSLIVASTD
ncbi:MAG: DUF1330 domain-containing protein [Chloroflexota bacterium]|nr:DUF1330 domain-containing protein [Chloroflexota bacterium]MDE2960255.1 DUF1330 domain-containing protein [Chloroflexota bacterium]